MDFNKETKEKLESILNLLSINEMREFVTTLLEKYGSEYQLKHSLAAADVLIDYLKARKMFNPLAPNKSTDTAIAAVLVHNLFYDRTLMSNKEVRVDSWMQVFKLRNSTKELRLELGEKNYGVMDAIDYVYQIVEAQMGEEMPVIACRPVNGQITYIVWEVLWFYYNYLAKTPEVPKHGL